MPDPDKHSIMIGAALESEGNALLLQTAIALHQTRAKPETLNRHRSPGGAVRLTFVSAASREVLQRLADRLNEVPGVRTVTLAGVSDRLPRPTRMMEQQATDPEQRSFTD